MFSSKIIKNRGREIAIFASYASFLPVSLGRVQCLLMLVDRVPGILATECGKKSLLTTATAEGPVNHLYKVGLNTKQYSILVKQ